MDTNTDPNILTPYDNNTIENQLWDEINEFESYAKPKSLTTQVDFKNSLDPQNPYAKMLMSYIMSELSAREKKRNTQTIRNHAKSSLSRLNRWSGR